MAAQKALTGDINDDTNTEDKEKDNEDGWTEHQEVSSIYIEDLGKYALFIVSVTAIFCSLELVHLILKKIDSPFC
jgi:hypothetical protein